MAVKWLHGTYHLGGPKSRDEFQVLHNPRHLAGPCAGKVAIYDLLLWRFLDGKQSQKRRAHARVKWLHNPCPLKAPPSMTIQKGLHNVKGATCGQRGYMTLAVWQGDVRTRWLHEHCNLGGAQSKEKVKKRRTIKRHIFFYFPTRGQNQSAYMARTILGAPVWAKWQNAYISLAVLLVPNAATK